MKVKDTNKVLTLTILTMLFTTFFLYFADSHNILAQSSSSLTNALTYSNPTYNVSIKYPSNWEIDETDYDPEDRTKTIVGFYSPFENHSDPFSESLTVSKDEGLFYDADLDEYLAETIDAYKSDPALDFKLLQSNTTSTLSGNPAYSLTYTSILEAENKGEENGTLKSYEIGTLVNNTVYYITFDADENAFDEYFPIAQGMIDTFRTKAPPPSPSPTETPAQTETQTDQATKPTIPAGFSEYVNTGYGVKMVYPTNWEASPPSPEEVQGGILVTFVSPQRSMLDQFQEYVKVWLNDMDIAAPQNMQYYLNDTISAVSELGFEVVNSTANYMLAGKPAIKIEYRAIDEDEIEQQRMIVGTIVDNKEYRLIFGAEPARYSEYLPVVEKMINSFEIPQKSLGTGARASNVVLSTPFIELFQIEWLKDNLGVHIVVNQDTQEQASRYLPVVEEAINQWSDLLKQYSGNYNAWNFNVSSSVGYLDNLGPNASKDIIIEITGDPQALGCNDYLGAAEVYHEDISTGIPLVIITSCTDQEGNVEDYPEDDVYSTALHEFAHALGLGHAFNMERDLMCSGDTDYRGKEIQTCTYGTGRVEPSEADVMALLYRYGTDGFSPPNRDLVGHRPVYEPSTPQLCAEGETFNEETQTCEPAAGDTTELPVEEPIAIECAEGERFNNVTGACEPQPYTTYTNETLDIKFQYPNDWTLATEDLDIGMLYVNDPNLEKGVSITKYNNEEMEGISDLQTFTEEDLQLKLELNQSEGFEDYKILEIEDPKIISIGNLEMGTFKVESKYEEDPEPTTSQIWTTIVDGQGYVVEFYTPTSTFNSTGVSELRDHIIKSFKILSADKTTTIPPTVSTNVTTTANQNLNNLNQQQQLID